MKFYWFLLGALVVWRITHLLNAEDGPADVLVRLRRLVGTGFWGGLLDCFYCLSLWVAAPLVFVLAGSARERLLLWPALSAAAIMVERLTQPRAANSAPGQAWYFEQTEEDKDALLRREENGSSGPATNLSEHPDAAPASRRAAHSGSHI
jgi:hypothetical protein